MTDLTGLRGKVAQLICCGERCILEGTDGGCILNLPEHDGDLKKAEAILAIVGVAQAAPEGKTVGPLNYALGYERGYYDAIAEAPQPAASAYAAPKPVGWFQYSDYHGWQQVAKEYEGGEGQTALYALSSTHQSAPHLAASHNSGERPLSSDAGGGGADTAMSSTHQQDAAK